MKKSAIKSDAKKINWLCFFFKSVNMHMHAHSEQKRETEMQRSRRLFVKFLIFKLKILNGRDMVETLRLVTNQL